MGRTLPRTTYFFGDFSKYILKVDVSTMKTFLLVIEDEPAGCLGNYEESLDQETFPVRKKIKQELPAKKRARR